MWKGGGIKIERTRARYSFLRTDKEISEKRKKRPLTQKRREILGWAIKGLMMAKHRGTNTFWAKIGCGAVLTLFWSFKVGRGRPTAIR